VSVCLIQVPYHAGDDRHASSAGPRRFLEAGAAELLAAQGHGVTVKSAERGAPFRDTASSSAAVNRQVAAAVREAVAAEQLPLVFAGSCVTCQGVLAGFDHADCGAVWIDAHADFNTPDTAVSGFFPGMSLAVIAGHCYSSYWAEIGDSTPVAEEAIAMFGVRDLSPQAERDRLERSAIQVVPWRAREPQGDVIVALDTLAARVRDVYLHVDFDGFAPEVAPGIVDEPVPGGLSLEDGEEIIRAAAERFRIKAATLATFTPERDADGKTLRLGLRIIELLGEWAGSAQSRPRSPRMASLHKRR
jgi:arginase